MAAVFLGSQLALESREVPVTVLQPRPVFLVGPDVIELTDADVVCGGAVHLALVDQVIGWRFRVEPGTPHTPFISNEGYMAAGTGAHTANPRETSALADLLRASLPKIREVALAHYAKPALVDNAPTRIAVEVFRSINAKLCELKPSSSVICAPSGNRVQRATKRPAEFTKVGA